MIDHLGDWGMAQLVKCLLHTYELEFKTPLPPQNRGSGACICDVSIGWTGGRWTLTGHNDQLLTQ